MLTEFSQWDFRSQGFWVGLTTGVEIMQWITENRTKQVPTDTFPFVRPCVEQFDRGWGDGWDANEHILRGE